MDSGAQRAGWKVLPCTGLASSSPCFLLLSVSPLGWAPGCAWIGPRADSGLLPGRHRRHCPPGPQVPRRLLLLGTGRRRPGLLAHGDWVLLLLLQSPSRKSSGKRSRGRRLIAHHLSRNWTGALYHAPPHLGPEDIQRSCSHTLRGMGMPPCPSLQTAEDGTRGAAAAPSSPPLYPEDTLAPLCWDLKSHFTDKRKNKYTDL